MGGEDNGTTIIKDGGQLGIEVFPIYFGEPCEGLGEITSGQTMTVTLPPGTTLGFKSTDADEDYDIYITTAAPGEEPTKYSVYPLLKPVDELGYPWTSVPNFDSVLHGFNILYMDPFVIDCAEGKKGFVYEPLASNGRDYDTADGNVYFKRGFNYGTLNTGWGTSQTQVHTSEESFQKAFNAELSGGVDNAGTLSAGYKTMTEQVNGARSMYTTSREVAHTYAISVKMDEAKLKEEFVEAVKALPYDDSINASTTYGQLSHDMQTQLSQFIDAYGTHMSMEMTFGGYYALVNSMKEDDMKTTTQKGTNIGASATVPVEGVPVTGSGSGGYENLDSSSMSVAATVTKYIYRGGNGGVDGWGVDDIGDSQALKVTLQRVHEVLQPEYFPVNEVPSAELETKKIALGLAITSYIGSPYDPNPAEMKPMIFKIEYLGMKLTNASSHKKSVCGKVYMKPSDTLNKYQLSGNLKDPYILFDKSESSPYDLYNDGSIPPESNRVNVSKFQPPFEAIGDKNMFITLSGDLSESDKGSSARDKYNTTDVIVKLGGNQQADYWVDLAFNEVDHEVSGYNVKSKDGRIHVNFKTSWVEPN